MRIQENESHLVENVTAAVAKKSEERKLKSIEVIDQREEEEDKEERELLADSYSPCTSLHGSSSPESLSPISTTPITLKASPFRMKLPPPPLMSQSTVSSHSGSFEISESISESPSTSPLPSRLEPQLESKWKLSPPMWALVKTWVFYIMIPFAVVAWSKTSSVLSVIAAVFVVPVFAILQGAFGILNYRIFYAKSPLPPVPCHGVVIVDPEDRSTISSPSFDLPVSKNKDFISDRAILDKINHQTEPPLRLLVIGDSLAIGVGQKKSATPRMPEVIAKSLSKALGGRAVYWTCHGAPGASAGWVIRELEQGAKHPQNDFDEEEDEDFEDWSIQLESNSQGNTLKEDALSSCSETTDMEETSSDDSSEDSCSHRHQLLQKAQSDTFATREGRLSRKLWKERLKQHRKRFDPDTMGPYDVSVVLTGSNDLKSACFPFLLQGEDKEFQRQAQERGGYDYELRRLFNKLRESVEHFRESVETASENVMGKIKTGTTHQPHPSSQCKTAVERVEVATCTNRKKSEREKPLSSDELHSILKPKNDTTKRGCEKKSHKSHSHLVVLPGLPSRALPIFRAYPLRWLAIPFVDMMDAFKRNLARGHPDEVLFVEPVTLEEMALYEAKKGPLWDERCREGTMLSINDVHKSQIRRIENDMKTYYEAKRTQLQRRSLWSTVGDKIFSVDRIHPTDEGYDFWGRQIASAIIIEWKKKQII